MLKLRLEGLLVRFGRILISLSALMAAMAATPAPRQSTDSLARLLRSVAHLVTPAAEASVTTPAVERQSPQAVLPFAALVSTPFRHALWMIASVSAIDLSARRHQRMLLRC
jgi:hypothetical protein